MNTKKILRGLGYSGFFIIVFSLTFYFTFPVNRILGLIVRLIEDELSQSITNRATVQVENISLWRFSGIYLKNVHMQVPINETKKALINLNGLGVKLAIIRSLYDGPNLSVQVHGYDGEVKADMAFSKEMALTDLSINAQKISLHKIEFIPVFVGFPLSGTLQLDTDISIASEFSKDASGYAKWSIKNAVLGPGSIQMGEGFGGGIPVPKVNFNNFIGDIRFEPTKAIVNEFKMEGGDLAADLKGEIALKKTIKYSSVDVAGTFSMSDAFKTANPTMQTLIDFNPAMQRARGSDGKYPLKLKGVLGRPLPSFSGKIDIKTNSPDAKA